MASSQNYVVSSVTVEKVLNIEHLRNFHPINNNGITTATQNSVTISYKIYIPIFLTVMDSKHLLLFKNFKIKQVI